MILISILAFVGIFVGLLLAHLARDELKSGKKYFVLFYRILLFVLIIYLLYLAEINWWLLGIIAGLIVSLFLSELYFYLGLAVFSSLNIYIAFIVFLIGLPHGTLLYGHKKLKEYLVMSGALFSLAGLIFLVFPNTIHWGIVNILPNTFFYAFTAGALFSLFLRKIK